MRLYNQDNREALKELADNSVDSIVTDPPYGLSFMNKKWDYDVPSVEFWREVYRVLKPGGHILSFGGTRTYHRMVVNIEDAGFEIRDQIQWIYGVGFPKSLNIGKAVGKYVGWGSQLKPANEPICLARKPLSEKSIAENVMRWRTGGLNIDGCRIGNEGETKRTGQTNKVSSTDPDLSPTKSLNRTGHGVVELNEGRFPANVILECCCDEVIQGDIHTNPDCPCYIMDEQSGVSKSTKMRTGDRDSFLNSNDVFGIKNDGKTKRIENFGDGGGASRFFYRAKVSKKERNLGLDDFEDKKLCQGGYNSDWSSDKENDIGLNKIKIYKNNHPTVKPINLLTYLCRLITPPNGVVLDPFMGSGSTGVAALLEGFDFIGMELEKDYYEIAKRRIEKYQLYKNIIK